MTSEFLIPMATGAGSALAAGILGFQLARRRFGEEKTAYVRLSAEDSDRLEKIEALLERLISLESRPRRCFDLWPPRCQPCAGTKRGKRATKPACAMASLPELSRPQDPSVTNPSPSFTGYGPGCHPIRHPVPPHSATRRFFPERSVVEDRSWLGSGTSPLETGPPGEGGLSLVMVTPPPELAPFSRSICGHSPKNVDLWPRLVFFC